MVDFEGQKLAETIFYVLILSFGGVGWVLGYMRQDFTVVFQAWLVGVLLSVVVSSSCFGRARAAAAGCYGALLAMLYWTRSLDEID